MKAALSGMLLGASMLGANAETYTFAKSDGTQGDSITADAASISGNGLQCTAAHDHGTAYGNYGDDPSAADLAGYEAGSKLAFFCGIQGQFIDDAKGAPHQGDKILLKLDGTATDCGPDRIRNPTDDDTDSSTSTGGTPGARLFKPVLNVKVLYKCIQAKGTAGPTVEAELRVKRISDAHDIVSGDAAKASMTLFRSGPNEFSAADQVIYDLGTNKPHSAYYTSTGLEGGCGDGDLCLGSIRLDAQGFGHKDIPSALTGTWASDQYVPYFGLSAEQCEDVVREQRPGISKYDACGISKSLNQGGSGLLSRFDCPFDAAITNALASEAKVDECLAKGKMEFLSNSCDDRTWGSEDQIDLVNGFHVKLRWNDPDYHSGFTALTLNDPSIKDVPEGTKSVDWTISGITGVDHVQGLYVSDGGTFKQYVALSGGNVTAYNVPVGSTTLQLRGGVLMRSSCNHADTLLAQVNVQANVATLPDGGQFTMLNECDGKFAYSNGAGEIVSGIHAPGKDVTIRFCVGSESAAQCKAAEVRSNSNSEAFAVIEGACDNVHEGDVGALIEIQGKTPAPVICPKVCASVNLGRVTLDWKSEFKLSLTDGATENKLTASQNSTYSAEKVDVSQSTHLASYNQCGADGKVYGSVATGCALDDAALLTKASEFVELFQQCGNTQSDSPSVYLVSEFVVDLVDGSKLHFCNAKLLSIQQENMQGESTSSLGIVAETANAADAMSAAFSFIGYSDSGCSNGQYKLMATMDIDTEASNVALTNDDGTFAQLEDGTTSVAYDSSSKVLTFSTVCADICTAGGAYDDQYDLKAELGDGNGAGLNITAEIQVEGTPCGVADDNLDRGVVVLSLYGVDKKVSALDCTQDASPDQTSVSPDSNDVCASIAVSGMGSGDLKIVSEALTRTTPGSNPEEIGNVTFFPLASYANDATHKSDGGVRLAPEDAMTTYTLTIVWQQQLSSRRLLRTTHVFGAADHESKSSLFILPAAAQIQDAAESLDSKPAASTEDSADEEKEDDMSWFQENLGWTIVGVILLTLVVSAVVMRMERVRSWFGWSSSGSRTNFAPPAYSQVRRSERFSSVNF